MTSVLVLGLVWLAVAVVVALPLGWLLRRVDARQVAAPTVPHGLGAEVLAAVVPDRAVSGSRGQPAAGPPPAERAVQPAHADPTISRTS